MRLRKPVNLSRYKNTGVVDDRIHLPERSKESASHLVAGALATYITEKDLCFLSHGVDRVSHLRSLGFLRLNVV